MLNLAKKKKKSRINWFTKPQKGRKYTSLKADWIYGLKFHQSTFSLSPSVFPSHFYFCILAAFKWELQPLLALEPTLTASMPKTKTDLLFLLQLGQSSVRKGLMWMYPMSVYGFPGGASSKEPTHQGRRRGRCGFDPWVGKIP